MKKSVVVPKPIRFTKEGYKEMKKKYDDIKKERPDAVATLSRARTMGDLSENGFYKAAKGKLISIDSEISRLKHFLKYGVIQKKKSKVVDIESIVVVRSNNKKTEYHIVGDYEADPKKKKISLNSPIGRALEGKKVNDKILVRTPSGEVVYKIIKIK